MFLQDGDRGFKHINGFARRQRNPNFCNMLIRVCVKVRVRVGIRPVVICGQLAQFSFFSLRTFIEHASFLIRAAVSLDDVMAFYRESIRYIFATIDPFC